MFENRNFVRNSKFCWKIRILINLPHIRNFNKTSKFWSSFELKLKYWPKIEIWIKYRNFLQNFGQKSRKFSKNLLLELCPGKPAVRFLWFLSPENTKNTKKFQKIYFGLSGVSESHWHWCHKIFIQNFYGVRKTNKKFLSKKNLRRCAKIIIPFS